MPNEIIVQPDIFASIIKSGKGSGHLYTWIRADNSSFHFSLVFSESSSFSRHFLESRCVLCDRRSYNRGSYGNVPMIGKSTRQDGPLVSDRHCHLRPDSRPNASVVAGISPL